MLTCTKFAKYTESFTGAVKVMNTVMDESMGGMMPPSQTEKIQKAIRRLNEFEDGFIYHMKILIDALNHFSATETVRFLCLVVRLDYNQFYANQNLSENLLAQTLSRP